MSATEHRDKKNPDVLTYYHPKKLPKKKKGKKLVGKNKVARKKKKAKKKTMLDAVPKMAKRAEPCDWQCKKCTFVNHKDKYFCGVCGEKKKRV